jgi:hypothetical protein
MVWIFHRLIVTSFSEEGKCISPYLFLGFCVIDRWILPTQSHEEPENWTVVQAARLHI